MVATQYVSPGVFSKIIDLSEYVRSVPSTIGFIPFFCEQGPDNTLIYTNSVDFYKDFGEPNINYVGKDWGSGPYVAAAFLEQSDNLYVMRVLPTDATFPTLFLLTDASVTGGLDDTTADVYTDWVVDGSMKNKDAISSKLADFDSELYNGLCAFYTIGRGAWYGSDSTEILTPSNNDKFLINIEMPGKAPFFKSDGARLNTDPVTYKFPGNLIGTLINIISKTEYDALEDGVVLGYVLPDYNYKQEEDAIYEVSVLIKQSTRTDSVNEDNVVVGFVPDFQEIERFEISFNSKTLDNSGDSMWIEDVINRNSRYIRCLASAEQCKWAIDNGADFSQPFEATSGIALRDGSDGSLIDSDGNIVTTEDNGAKALMIRAYNGTLNTNQSDPSENLYVNEVLDKEITFFTVAFDGGYPSTAVKSALAKLCERRGDCVGIIDNFDNSKLDAALASRAGRAIGGVSPVADKKTNGLNTYRVAIYEGYTKVFDEYTGRDIWITPVAHMARIIPYNDKVGEIWYAPAGFNRAAISNIDELRYSPNLSQRDRLYLVQLNPIVRFADLGDTVFGQLTSQRRPTALQDLNVVRLVLYCQKAIEQFCQFYIFELNDAQVWDAISAQVTSFLKVIQGRRGLRSFNVEVGATEYELKAKQIHVNITLVPTKVIEQIYLNFFIK